MSSKETDERHTATSRKIVLMAIESSKQRASAGPATRSVIVDNLISDLADLADADWIIWAAGRTLPPESGAQ